MISIANGVWWLASSCLALSLVVSDGYSIGPALLILLSPFTVLMPKFKLSRQDIYLFSIFFGYFLLMSMFVYIDGGHTRELDRPSRFLLVIPAFFLMLYSCGNLALLWFGAIVGSFGAFFVAFYELVFLHESRAGWYVNSIMFGDTSILLGAISAVSALYFFYNRQIYLVFLALLALVAGVLGGLLSGSRGGWIAVPITLLFVLWHCRELLGKKGVLGVLVLSAMCFILIYQSPMSGVSVRLHQTYQNVHDYFKGRTDTSVGYRFQMWEANIRLFSTSPILGVGEYHGLELKKRLAEEGIIDKGVAKFSHAHNEYLDALGLRGIVGFLALIIVYLVPLVLFLNKIQKYKSNWSIKAYALAGSLVPLAYMCFAMTQSMFSHNIGVMMYVFPIIFFWSATRRAEKITSDDNV